MFIAWNYITLCWNPDIYFLKNVYFVIFNVLVLIKTFIILLKTLHLLFTFLIWFPTVECNFLKLIIKPNPILSPFIVR